ncbi:MAG: tRNA(Ile)-lysidine synthase, partial [Bacteroidota bacterium]|nr:tRNA(Ile)-lysidine synthase [Bacteroidota bacterium]
MKKKSKSKNNQTGQVISDGERKIEVQTRNYEKQQNTAQKPFRDKIKAERQSKEINSRKLYTPEEKKNPIIQKFINSVEEFLLRELYIPDGSELLIAVSGGVDSCVLLDIIANISVNHKYILNVAHYNHGLRGSDSDSDENFVGKIAAEYNIPFHHSKGKVKQYAKKNALCIEHAARVLRYIFLERTSGMLKAEYVATAHTADDLAETFFINLFRGSGLTGLAAIPSKRLMSKTVKLIRPLIKMKKKDIIEYAKLRNLKWREDYTNAMVNF